MLGRLIQGYGKGTQGLESATEEQHSRSLLWPQQFIEPGHWHGASPPGTPVGSPTFRVGPYDDRGGLELNESKDVRIIIAQDAFGGMDKPMVLFDSYRPAPVDSPQAIIQSLQPNDPTSLRLGQKQSLSKLSAHQRNRSATMSGAPNSWTRPAKDPETNERIGQLLECMFGVTSATKTGSSTKMHVLFSDQESSPMQPYPVPVSPIKMPPGRGPLLRSRTASQSPGLQKPPIAPKDISTLAQDTVLVTRMFPVPLSEAAEVIATTGPSTYDSRSAQPSSSPLRDPSDVQGGATNKKPKLVEKKTPMFAVGYLFRLPAADQRIHLGRPPSRASFASFSLPNSYENDLASSWTLMEAIPESLASSQYVEKTADRRVEFITDIWDVILRSLSALEHVARDEIQQLLQRVSQELTASLLMAKSPKGPQEQRTNQRTIYIRTPGALVNIASIEQISRRTVRRICYALRIPKAITGAGFVDGHWLEEARYLVHACGSKQQNFFLFNLLTAFLGNHTEWLEKLSPEWYQKQCSVLNKIRSPSTALASRTIIIADKRSIARRLVFLLASFLPTRHGFNTLERDALQLRSPLHTPGLGTSSPSKKDTWQPLTQFGPRHRSRGHHVSFGNADAIAMSTSASSTGSAALSSSVQKDLKNDYLKRVDSDAVSLRSTSILPVTGAYGSIRKTSAVNSTATPNPATPVPIFSTKQDSYFPEGVLAEPADSVASADLARILRRDSSSYAQSSGPSTAWGSLISNMSGFWAKKNDSSKSNPTTPHMGPQSSTGKQDANTSPSTHVKPAHTKLQAMVSEASTLSGRRQHNGATAEVRAADKNADLSGADGIAAIEPPRLRVDDRDGVIDVDVGIHGFLSWDQNEPILSPPSMHHKSPSIKSLDGVSSIHSFKSNLPGRSKSGAVDGLSVAGFLKRYHEDFSLQAVRAYNELEDEVRQSMVQEAVSEGLLHQHSRDGRHHSKDDECITICSTLIADLRKFTIQRLTLRQRRLSSVDEVDGENMPHNSQASLSDQAYGIHEFVVEPVNDFDATLTDAIESILGVGGRLTQDLHNVKSSHARTVSGGTVSTAKSTPPSSLLAATKGPQLLRAECRQIVAGALEEVIRSVNDDLSKHQKGRDIKSVGKPTKQGEHKEMRQENVLREGVKDWLLDVETKSVW